MMQTAALEKLLTEKEVAAAYHLSVRTLQNWRLKGGGPRYCKLGSCVRYRASDLDDFLNASNIAHSSEAQG